MTKNATSIVGPGLLALLFVSTASGQQRTFVSGLGNDANPCTRSAPCRTFSQAISQANAGGEVIALDSAGYGAFPISKPVSIIAAPGAYAGISVFSGNGIDIAAGASDTIILRGLTIDNQGAGGAGIYFKSGGTLHIENCVVNGFAYGLSFQGGGELHVNDSTFRGNDHGIYLSPSPDIGGVRATVDHVRLLGNKTNGLFAGSFAVVTVTNSIASHNGNPNNGGSGFAASGSSGLLFSDATLYIENCAASSNNIGILGTGHAFVTVGASTVTDNNIGLDHAGGLSTIFWSRQNSTVIGNSQDTLGTIGPFPFGGQ